MKPSSIQKHAVSIMLFLLFFSVAHSQSGTTENERPKVGLVLSGGGAKGLAHIGVIKVLEEYGIKPDYITGTSMGSIVGSLYGAGYTPAEITEINHNANWDVLLTDDIGLRNIAMNVKPESDKYAFSFGISDKKLQLPNGLIEGQHLRNFFAELLWGLTSEEDFNELPIPFHCMSVDLISGATIEHESGSVVEAIRASMAVPSVFTPVETDSMLLVDGGVTRNFPVQEAIDMGADIIIGVYLGFEDEVTTDDLNSIAAILSRAVVLGGIIDTRDQFKKCDVLILPDLGGLGAGDFTEGKQIQEYGEKATRLHEKELKALVEKYNLSTRPVKKIEQPEKVRISKIEVENLVYLSESSVIARSGFEPGDSISHKDVMEAIDYMYGSTYFKGLNYSLKKDKEQEGDYVLVFEVKENARTTFNMAVNYDDDLGVGLVTNFTFKNIVRPSSRLLTTLNIAENPGVSILLDKKFGKKQHFSDHFLLNWYNYKLGYYSGGDKLGEYRRGYFEAGYGIDYLPGLNHRLGAQFLYRYNRLKPNEDFRQIFDEANFEKFRTHEWAYQLYYKVNTTDHLYFPKRGSEFEVSFTHAFYADSKLELKDDPMQAEYFVTSSDKPYATLFAEYSWYKTFWKRVTGRLGISGGFNTEDARMNGTFMLGGTQFNNKLNYKNFAGFNFAELFVSDFAMAKLGLNVELIEGLYLSGNFDFANLSESYEDLFESFSSNSFDDYTYGYNFGLKYDSLLGPVQFFVSDNNRDDEVRFHFSIGFPF